MTRPSEHKAVQARILVYAQEIAWTYVPPKRFKAATTFVGMPNSRQSGP
jgi:hypothetical protein